ncbi:hypothetical protein EDEG_02472 [Edhazardia aedis USNM 41457]|uniref:Large ribosomal subunit protein uL15/eL18 domain-containing protein n=1 Tax=Edhazardia aedis (strain USNM 41457) TaxID=1003232 RepID=J9DPA0_EDHAE|nr:hypothetical protein EDEG_02472 [Edhazardia aedis USNM 41457]|eukprot:EJW03167.1 hypothetical protein EDEG_02472 [Edhazardia aedis USNM 41457]
MATGKTKTRKLRGHVSHGHGRVGKHRKHSGGRGKAGAFKHMRSWFLKYHPSHFGKHGQRIMGYRKSRYWFPEIDVKRVWKFVPKDEIMDYVNDTTIAPVIDVTQFGYAKVVGNELSFDRPVVVKAKSFTKEAEEAIVKAGGQCMLVA